MIFWDSSALLPLIVQEDTSDGLIQLQKENPSILIWTLTPIEVISALCRLERMAQMSSDNLEKALQHWEILQASLHVVKEIESVKQRAIRLLKNHSLRAADSLQLAAALVAFSDHPQSQSFVCLDERLSQAAKKEGFKILPPK